MIDILQDLLANGFSIVPHQGRFLVAKNASELNPLVINPVECRTYGEAIETALDLLKTKTLLCWSVTIRYNRGLGIEYKNISDIFAETKDQALELANDCANKFFNDNKTKICEVRVRIKI